MFRPLPTAHTLPMISICRVSLALFCFLSLGCQPESQVETYSVDRTAPPRPALDAAKYLDQLDHILVAIVPQRDKAWFFKLVGKASAIDRQREAFDDFLTTVKLAESSGETPSWTLPEGWGEKEASGMRAATLVVPDEGSGPDEGGELELAVSSLPLTEDWEDFLVPNVNRWLDQLQRTSLPRATLLKLARKVATSNAEATVFELSGKMSQRPMGGPFRAAAGPHAGGVPHEEKGSASSQTSAKQPLATSKEWTYETPEGWLPGKMSMMRKAAFLLPDGGSTDEVTVTSFPAAPGTQMADVTANVQRWAGQVGASVTSESLKDLTKPITVSGIEGTYVELTSPAEREPPVALYVAMIERQGQVWFFKMVGKRELVSGQRDAFRKFLSSVKFP